MNRVFKKGIAIILTMAMVVAPGIQMGEPSSAAGKVKLNKTKVTLKVGKSTKLRLKNAKGKVTWKSTNKKVASVNSKGVVKAKSAGSTKIIAKNKKKSYTCKVKISAVNYPDGKVLNIYTWNEEFPERLEQYYPGYNDGWIGDVKVNFVINVNEGSNYQDKLDVALRKQSSAKPNDKVDIFLVEADYSKKYTSKRKDFAIPVSELGITENDTSNMFEYTKQVAMDEDGVIRGLTWQASPSGMIYRRSMAKKYFDTDNPNKIQELVSDWDKFEDACAVIKEKSKGKDYMMAGPNDMHRIYFNNDTEKFVEGDRLNFTPGIEQWVDNTKKFCDNGYVKSPTMGLWSEDWFKHMGAKGHVFAYFGPAWFVSYMLSSASGAIANDDGTYEHIDGKDSYGDWAICEGPGSFNWGGSWIMAARGTDNEELVKDIMLKMTCDQTILYSIARDKWDFVNGKKACDMLSEDGVREACLGGQDMIGVLKKAAENISMTNLTIYDQACIETAEGVFANYFNGKTTKEKCIMRWQDNILTKFLNLS